MIWLQITCSLILLLNSATPGLSDSRVPVFLDQKEANELIHRQKRANDGNEESNSTPNLERECLEEICSYEEAREVFQDTYRTDIFWSVYIDGDQCASKPCQNGAMCSDSVGGYDCICKSGFSGVHCEKDQTVCVIDKNKGCSQFCKPGYQSYECSCARGWKLDKEQCVPAVSFPCGKVSNPNQYQRRQTANVQANYEGLDCSAEECPWHAILRHSGSSGFCSAVIIKEDLLLTSAQCAEKRSDFQVAVGKRILSHEPLEQQLYVKQVHVHPLYVRGKPENDLAVIKLQEKILFKKSVVPACLPERDFAESVLMSGEYMGMVTGWKDAPEFQGQLRLNHLAYNKLPVCVERHADAVTNKMTCTLPRPKADCSFGPGSPVLTFYRDVFFLTGIVSQSEGMNCTNGYVLQKVSRFLPWLKPFMDSV